MKDYKDLSYKVQWNRVMKIAEKYKDTLEGYDVKTAYNKMLTDVNFKRPDYTKFYDLRFELELYMIRTGEKRYYKFLGFED